MERIFIKIFHFSKAESLTFSIGKFQENKFLLKPSYNFNLHGDFPFQEEFIVFQRYSPFFILLAHQWAFSHLLYWARKDKPFPLKHILGF